MWEAIAGDVSLQPITRGVVQLAVDLCAIAPLVPDVAHVVRRAGAWMREDPADPRRRKTKGNTFLVKWLEREQDRFAALPQPAPAGSTATPGRDPRWANRGPAPPPPPVPKAVLRGVEELHRREAAGEQIPTFEEMIKTIGDRHVAPIRDVC